MAKCSCPIFKPNHFFFKESTKNSVGLDTKLQRHLMTELKACKQSGTTTTANAKTGKTEYVSEWRKKVAQLGAKY